MTVVFAAIFIISARGQGFLNLDFESAQNLPSTGGASVSVANALPNWTAYAGLNTLSAVYYVSNIFLGSSPVELEAGSLALSGHFSVGLYNSGSISQTGSVPNNAESLLFEAEGPGTGGSLGASGLEVMLGGQSLSLSALSDGSGYTVYGANVPADMDDQVEALTFLIRGGGDGGVLLDNIEFSSMSVPEPSQFALVGLGAILLSLRYRRNLRA